MPFVLALSYVGFAFAELWVPAVLCVVALSFVTYGSISHDLVHRSWGLRRDLNDWFLTAIELLMLRSGRAYRLAHLNHHARYPSRDDDPEAIAAYGTFWQAIRSGPLFFLRLWWWAVRKYPSHRPRLIAEASVVVLLAIAAVGVAIVGWSLVPLLYAGLAYLGTWVVPLVTAYIPHLPEGETPLGETRRFRGMVLRLIAFDHLYHLEHHLFPAVPHHRWPELATRLDPYLDLAGVPAITIGIRTG
ncbi:MAG: fatty acid desaturase [Planctomycetaceae bacterium]|nr:fatty acid desaturase [Planctomycetaceae bacterium]